MCSEPLENQLHLCVYYERIDKLNVLLSVSFPRYFCTKLAICVLLVLIIIIIKKYYM